MRIRPTARGCLYIAALLVAVQLVGSRTACAQVQSGDPILGVWLTVDDSTGRARGLIRISKAAGQYLGTIERGLADDDSPDARCTACTDERHNQPLSGMVILEGLQRKDNDTYSAGRILDPETGRTWQCDIHVMPDGRSLVIRGFVGLRVFGRSQTWWRQGARTPAQ